LWEFQKKKKKKKWRIWEDDSAATGSNAKKGNEIGAEEQDDDEEEEEEVRLMPLLPPTPLPRPAPHGAVKLRARLPAWPVDSAGLLLWREHGSLLQNYGAP
jgi:hypothetical protein